MNAIATETLGRMCVERDVERLVFASSCSLYDGLPPGMHDETARRSSRAAPTRPPSATARRRCMALVARGPVPGHLPQRHRLRLQPAHALRPRGQHVRQGRAAARQALAARRRLDVAPAGRRPRRLRRDDRRPRGARREGPRRDLQRPALQLPDPRARDARRRLGAAARPLGHARGAARAEAHARLRVLEHQAREHARLPAVALGRRGDRRHPGRDRRRGPHDAHGPALLQHPLARAAQRDDAADRPRSRPRCEPSDPHHRGRGPAGLRPRVAAPGRRRGAAAPVARRPRHHR